MGRLALSVAVVAIVTLLGTSATAQVDKSGTRPTSISVPRGPGSVQGLGESFEVDLNSGSVRETIPIQVPPGTHGAAPKLAISYNSGSGDGPLGVGWSLGVSSIQCETEKGLPRYQGNDLLLYEGAELVPLGGGVYRLKNEWQYVRVQESGAGFEVDLPSGTVRRYGIDSSDSQITSAGQTFAWFLEDEVDLFGNEISYFYTKDSGGYPYLTKIQYDRQIGSAQNEVDFSYGPRPDVMVDDKPTYRVTTDERLTDIRVFAGGTLVRHYALAYAPANTLSVLSKVTMTGADDQTALPPIQLSYSKPNLATQPVINFAAGPPDLPGTTADAELADMDGDGFPDIIVGDQGQQGWYRNLGGTAFGAEQMISPSPSVAIGGQGVDLVDMNHDGLVDLVVEDATGENFRYFPGQGSGQWGTPIYYTTIPGFIIGNPEVRFVDLDHDHIPDAFELTASSAFWWRNNGDGTWSSEAPLPLPQGGPTLDFSDARVKLVDMNGDGLLDLVFVDSAQVVYWPSLGRGNFDAPITMAGAPDVGTGNETRLQTADLNGDGLADLFYVDTDQVNLWIALPGGSYASELTIPNTPYADASLTVVRAADMNGNGSIDIAWFTPTNPPDERVQYVDVLDGLRPNLLTGIQNGLGLTRAVGYSNSGDEYEASLEAGTPWTTRLPFPVQLAGNSTESDSNGGSYLTTYQYANGYYDPGNREFRGFANVQEVKIGETADPTSVSAHTFDLGITFETFKGHEIENKLTGMDGTVFTDTQSTLSAVVYATGTDDRQVVGADKIQQDTFLYEGTASPAHTQETWTYDQFGNALTDSKLGRIVNGQPTPADETVITRKFANDSVGWILGRVYDEVTADSGGNQVAETRTYYDGQPFVGLPLGQIQNGIPTRVEKWVQGTSYVNVDRRSYDSFGNVIETLTPLGASHQIAYDAATHTFPVQETTAVDGTPSDSLTFQATYQGATGLVTSFTDANGAKSQFTYDPLQRLIAIARPGDAAATPTFQYVYTLANPLSTVETLERPVTNGSTTYASYNYYDGLGREIAGVHQAEGNQWVVSDRKIFSQRGAVLQEADPYFQSNSTLGQVPSTVPIVSYLYDVPGRRIQTTFPDGKITQTRYTPLQKAHWDAEDLTPTSPHANTPLLQQLDGQGRVIQVVELLNETTGQSQLATSFGYDAVGRRISVTNANGSTTSYGYDGLGRLLTLVHPDAGKRQFVYDDDGDCITWRDALGQEIQRTYDGADRVLTELYLDASGKSQGQITYHYDKPSPLLPATAPSAGRISWVEDFAGQEHFAYDQRGRQVHDLRLVTSTGAVSAGNYDTQQAFDNLDRLTTLTYPDGTGLRYTYNERGLLASIPGIVDSVAYEPHGFATKRVLANGITTKVGYDVHSRVTSLASTGPGSVPVQGLGYGYDGVGDLIVVTDSVHPSGNLSSAWNFQFDDLYRLTSATGPAVSVTLSHQYDAVSNLLQKSDVGAYAYAPPSQAGAQPDAVQSLGGQAFTTDANGSVTRSLGRTFDYNANGDLTQVTAGGTTVSSVYGYSGQRVIKQITGSVGSHTVVYLDKFSELRDGQLVKYVFAGDQRIASMGGQTPSQSPNALSLRDGPGRGRGARAGGLFAFALVLGAAVVLGDKRRSSLMLALLCSFVLSCDNCGGGGGGGSHAGSVFFVTDRQNGPTVLTDSSGDVLAQANDNPWGAQIVADSEPFGFAGQEWDSEAGLYAFGTRFYDPKVGRFLTVDKTVIDHPDVGVGDPQQLNPYAYARNNPASLRDEKGQLPQVIVGAAVGAVINVGVYTAVGLYNNQQLTWKGALGAGVSGAIVGGVAGATGGLSLLASSGGLAGANVVGGIANRAIVTGSWKESFDPTHMVIEAVTGAGGNLLGKGISAAAKALGPTLSRFGSAGAKALEDTASDVKPPILENGAGGAQQNSTALSTLRRTAEGEQFFHYGYSEQAASFETGIRPGGFATNAADLSGAEAQSRLALPHANAPNAVYTVSPEPGTWIDVNPVVKPAFGQPGGGAEVTFPNGTGPGTVSDPSPINQ
jgi:RHS repeat-associated protein